MEKEVAFIRPTFQQALTAWKALLAERSLPAECDWVFDENLCFEKDAAGQGPVTLAFQTRFTPPPPAAEEIAYDYFSEFEHPIVFYRLGTHAAKSVCVLLCDQWFSNKSESEGYVRRDNWGMLFRPGAPGDITEVIDEQRWKKRWVRERPLHDLDFTMNLRAVHEILAHGRVLSSYEHYAIRLLHAWRKMLGHNHLRG